MTDTKTIITVCSLAALIAVTAGTVAATYKDDFSVGRIEEVSSVHSDVSLWVEVSKDGLADVDCSTTCWPTPKWPSNLQGNAPFEGNTTEQFFISGAK